MSRGPHRTWWWRYGRRSFTELVRPAQRNAVDSDDTMQPTPTTNTFDSCQMSHPKAIVQSLGLCHSWKTLKENKSAGHKSVHQKSITATNDVHRPLPVAHRTNLLPLPLTTLIHCPCFAIATWKTVAIMGNEKNLSNMKWHLVPDSVTSTAATNAFPFDSPSWNQSFITTARADWGPIRTRRRSIGTNHWIYNGLEIRRLSMSDVSMFGLAESWNKGRY